MPILSALKESYLLWHNFLIHLPRLSRYTLGAKVDNLFTDILALALAAQYTKREEKRAFLEMLSRKLDQLKFFITLLWEAKGIDAAKYGQISGKLDTVGRMLGKWLQSI
ncbi:hypothetical protein A3F28_00955 [Candidatus Uhrbacteria bacterium RIFCSPHIGHO2_12_FULL_57_11]|uniref:Four helix bundle protein n=2 Tax=Candidatus Uhriibacteriota TaxID=1752732 RepID=A0A1F7UNN2_9BACT|nr:MAG: hypothetical protein A3D72_01565 [Candidatus Uhrbacteria bacterium RIFCSPHIGHO2_02_FULL_57_19]OGL79845.1 MAG: hypothetical protein A3F28_00955 [Candidatus Uhrbacteria bacterium RIFCSPHIGHO2_12_FULL_57_11]